MGSNGRLYKVLIAEDQAIIAFYIEETIRGFGPYATACAPTASDALRLIESTRFDAALLDIRLHGETSYQVADRLQAERIRFAFATGWNGGVPDRYSGVPVLRKPFGHEDLEDCLKLLVFEAPLLRAA